jgi:hypothetical protein
MPLVMLNLHALGSLGLLNVALLIAFLRWRGLLPRWVAILLAILLGFIWQLYW